jgi:hypothetical protein
MSAAAGSTRRRPCPMDRKNWLLRDQGYICAYCMIPFGSVIKRRSRLGLSNVNFDHFIPVAYTNGNPLGNWVASCNYCNGIKSALIFDSVDEVREYVEKMWEFKKMEVAWLAPVSSEEDPYRWAVKFGTYLAGLNPKLAGTIAWKKPYGRASVVNNREVA